jgi:hypothetical protein
LVSSTEDEDGIVSAVALQVYAAWLHPNLQRPHLQRLAHALLVTVMEGDATYIEISPTVCNWVLTLLSVHLHPAVLDLGVGTSPALAAAMAAVGSQRPQGLQVSAMDGISSR